MAKVTARYIGPSVLISKINGRVYDGNGKVIPPGKTMEPGDLVQFSDQEVYGQTLKFDPRGNLRPILMGIGKCVMPEHSELTEDEMGALGYEFHAPRQDVEPVEKLEDYLARLKAEKDAAEKAKHDAELDRLKKQQAANDAQRASKGA